MCLIILFGLQVKDMMELKTYIENVAGDKEVCFDEIVSFFHDNDWFGDKPEVIDGKAMISEDQELLYYEPLKLFLFNDGFSSLLAFFSNKFPSTTTMFKAFCIEESIDEVQFYVVDFLLYTLEKELALYNDVEMEGLVGKATLGLLKAHGDCLTFFLSWLRTQTKTKYHKEYVMGKRYTMDLQNGAYSFDEYIQLLYYLFNPKYIEDNEMYLQAANSINYTDTWLYLSLHYLCSLRATDLARIYHPDLPYEPQEVINRIRENTFADSDARLVLRSITLRMCVLPFTPHKTESASGIASAKFVIPDSCEVHMGKLFALAEAHRQLAGKPNMPMVRKISTYKEISRYMGDDIGRLFLNSDFRARSATKSYLQAIEMMADEILDSEGSNVHMKGYVLAALARSHKGSYGEFANSTFGYLKDAKMSGLTPEFVAFELFERGVLSCIPSMLLKILTNGKYDKLPVEKQTSFIKALNLSPGEIESVVAVVDKGRKQAEQIVGELVSSKADILTVLHRIGTGQAVSKEPESLCLISALGKMCPCTNTRQCIGCKYEISTKSTLLLMISEYKRMFGFLLMSIRLKYS